MSSSRSSASSSMANNSAHPYAQLDPSVEASPLFKVGLEAIQAVAKRFPEGAANQVADTQRKSKTEIQGMIHACNNFGNIIDKTLEGATATDLFNSIKDYKFGHCCIFSSFASGYIHKYHHECRAETVYVGGHNMLVINRARGSNKSKIDTWGKEAIIVDCWSKNIYYAKNFSQIQGTAPDVPHYKVLLHPIFDVPIDLVLASEHYLSGTPDVCEGKANDLVDSILDSWFIIDEAYIKQKNQAVTTQLPQFSSATQQYTNEQVVSIKTKLAILTQVEMKEWKAANRESGLLLYLTLQTSEQVKKWVAAINASGIAEAVPRREKNASEDLVIQVSKVKISELLALERFIVEADKPAETAKHAPRQ